MRTLLAIFCTLLLVNHALGASAVYETVGLGGDNHAASWKAGTPEAFTPGLQTDGRTFAPGTPLTWDVSVAASGTHSSGQPIWGLANIVFNLELRVGTPDGPLAEGVGWYSSINDGTGADPLENAAFTVSYHVGGNGPGRIVDLYADGGPGVGYFQYPTSHQHPIADNALVPEGRLVGMGAGYTHWVIDPGSPDVTTPGVGLTLLPNGQPGLGTGPVAEGQIDTSRLSPGTYWLKVIPGTGVNVLHGDGILTGQGGFAARPDESYGDAIMFVLTPEPGTLVLLCVGGVLLSRRQ